MGGRPSGLITDGEYDAETFGTGLLNANASFLSVGVGLVELAGDDVDKDAALPGWIFRILDLGIAALGVIDLANGAVAPDEGIDFLTAADLLDEVGNGVEAGRWGGVAAAGYSDRTRAVVSDVDAVQELDRQMQALMARQASAVQHAHLTVAGGMNALLLCYPVAWRIAVARGVAVSAAFQIAMVSAVLGGVSTMEYVTADESVEVGRQVDAIAEQYRALFQAGRRCADGAAVDVSAPASGDAARVESGASTGPGSSAVPTVAQLAARGGDGRAERLHAVLSLLRAGQAPDVAPGADNDPATTVPGPAAPLPANPTPPTGAGTPTPRAAQRSAPPGRAGTAVAPTEEPGAATETADQVAPRGADTGASGGVHPAGTAPLDRPAGQAPVGDESVAAPRST